MIDETIYEETQSCEETSLKTNDRDKRKQFLWKLKKNYKAIELKQL